MFLRPNDRTKDGKTHTYWSLVETVRTPDGPRQRTICYLGELNSSTAAHWRKTIQIFNAQEEAEQLAREREALHHKLRLQVGYRPQVSFDIGGVQKMAEA